MAEKRDYYEVLGVDKNASESEIKTAYRKKAMQFHPDKNPGDKEAEAKFREATEAYEVLKDPDKKAAYDRYGHSAFSGPNGSSGFGGFQNSNFNFNGDFSDIFSAFGDIFGGSFDFGGSSGRRKRSRAVDGADLRYNISISLKDAYNGVATDITFTAPVSCPECNGTGSQDGSKPEICPNCKGAGKIRKQQGFFVVENICPKCGGTGEFNKNYCKKCNGEGKINKERTLNVKIPAGIQDGNKIRIPNEGEAGTKGGRNGDLYIFVSVKKDSFFERDGNDLYCEVPVLLTTAVLGGEITIKTIDETESIVKVPSGTQSGTKLRLKGKGMPIMNSGGRCGDLIVKVNVEIPKIDSDEEKDIFLKLDEILKNKTSNSKYGFFKKFFKS